MQVLSCSTFTATSPVTAWLASLILDPLSVLLNFCRLRDAHMQNDVDRCLRASTFSPRNRCAVGSCCVIVKHGSFPGRSLSVSVLLQMDIQPYTFFFYLLRHYSMFPL